MSSLHLQKEIERGWRRDKESKTETKTETERRNLGQITANKILEIIIWNIFLGILSLCKEEDPFANVNIIFLTSLLGVCCALIFLSICLLYNSHVQSTTCLSQLSIPCSSFPFLWDMEGTNHKQILSYMIRHTAHRKANKKMYGKTQGR